MLAITLKQQKFVHHFIETGNGAQSARNAGFSPNCARQTAQSLLKKPEIQSLISEQQEELRHELKIERQNVVFGLFQAFEQAKREGQPQVMVSAMMEIGRICGLYQETDDNSQIELSTDIQSLSDRELQQLLESEHLLV